MESTDPSVYTALLAVGAGGERLTGVPLDRLTDRCHILETGDESYRLADVKRHRTAEKKKED